MSSWKKSFLMIDVSAPKNKDYWKLVDWLKENEFEFTDVDFGDGDDD